MTQLFRVDTQLHQKPAYVKSNGTTRVQGTFSVFANDPQVQKNASQGLTGSAQVIVGDGSGSMQTDGRIEALKQAARAIVENAQDGDILGMIMFSGSSTKYWLFDLQEVTAKSRNEMLSKISNVRTDDMTCFCEPLSEAIDALLARSELVKVIHFISDGHSTQGSMKINSNKMSDTAATLWLAENKIAANEMQFYVYGVSLGYNQAFMDELVLKAHGTFFHILSDGTGLDALMAMNAAKASLAVASKVAVEIKAAPGFSFFADPQTKKFEIYRGSTRLSPIDPRSANWLVDKNVGVVNAVQGIPYLIVLVGENIQIPAGVATWEQVIATMTITYELTDGPHEETIDMIQTFTRDSSLVVEDQSVVATMRQTGVMSNITDALSRLSVAQTMHNAALIASISQELTMLQSQAQKTGLHQQSAILTDVLDGMGSGDQDKARAAGTLLANSFDLNMLKGMGSGDSQ